MKKVFPYGAKHFQVSEKRGTKNIKEILAPSTVNLNDCEYVDNDRNSRTGPWMSSMQ